MFTMHCLLRWMSALDQCEKNILALGRVGEGARMWLTLIRDPRCKVSASCSVLARLVLISRRMKAARVKAVVQNIALTFVCLDSTKNPTHCKRKKLFFSLLCLNIWKQFFGHWCLGSFLTKSIAPDIIWVGLSNILSRFVLIESGLGKTKAAQDWDSMSVLQSIYVPPERFYKQQCTTVYWIAWKINVIYYPSVRFKGNSPSPYVFPSQHTDTNLWKKIICAPKRIFFSSWHRVKLLFWSYSFNETLWTLQNLLFSLIIFRSL